MTSQRETIQIVDKLIELTQHNQISWEGTEPPNNLVSPDVKIDLVYTTHHLNKIIRIFHKKYKYFMDESQYHWDSKMVFEFIDQSGNSLWQFPQTSNAWDLLNAVQYQNSNVSDFYRDMFGK